MSPLVLMLLCAAPQVSASSDAAAAPPKLKLVFLGLQPQGGISEETARSLSESLQSELTRLAAYDVISTSDLTTMLGIERQKQLLGCSEGAGSCMSELAGALNTSRAITGNVARIDNDVVLNLSLIDPQGSRAIGRVGRKIAVGGSLSPVYDALGDVVIELVNQDPQYKDAPFSKPRGFGGFTLGVRGEVEALLPSVSPVVFAEYAWKYAGVWLGIIATTNPGARLVVRLHPFTVWKLRPHLGLGATGFIRSQSVGLRGELGVTLGLGHVQLSLDGAYEQFLQHASGYASNAVLIGLGVGWLF